MESSDSIDKSWDTTSDTTTTTAQRSDPLASSEAPPSNPNAWMVNVAGRDIVEMSHADVVSKWRNGELAGSVLVWREGMENWARLESVPAFQIISKPVADDEPGPEDITNAVAVYERPAATLIFDEAVEAEWKGSAAHEPAKATRTAEPSRSARSASSRPPAPDLPALGPRRSPSPKVPVDEPPPPPPLPPRRSPPSARPLVRPSVRPAMPTIPGGLAPPAPRSSVSPASSPPSAGSPQAKTSSAPPRASSANGPIPGASPSSPLLAAIAAAASHPEPVVVAPAATPAAPTAAAAPAAPVLDEVSVSARLRAMKSVSLRNAALACAGSALIASLITGLVVGSRARQAARPAPEPAAKVVVVAPVPPSPAPTAEPAPAPVEAPKAEEPASGKVEKVALAETELEEKPKPKPAKVPSWKPPKATVLAEGDAEKVAPNPERDDPERAVPDKVEERPAQPATWQADPGF